MVLRPENGSRSLPIDQHIKAVHFRKCWRDRSGLFTPLGHLEGNQVIFRQVSVKLAVLGPHGCQLDGPIRFHPR